MESWKCHIFDATGKSNDLINYQQWRMTWYGFLKLLDIDYKKGFCCPVCGQYPEVLSCDATTLSFRRTFALCMSFGGTESDQEQLAGR